jgi:phage-related protein
MAGGSRTLKLSILGDVSNLNQSLKTAGGDVDSFGDKMGKAGKAVGLAFAAAAAAAGAYAIKIGIEGVKAAIADEQAQTKLAVALTNSAGATDLQIKATEAAILKMSLASGVADDDLRPSLSRLVRSTQDTEAAQKLLAIALDVSTATGKPLESVSNALAKGFDGNTASLGKLGIGLDAAQLKTMSFEEVTNSLSTTFGGAAAANAETYAGKIARMQVAFDEAKETLGTALLPILDKVMSFINTNALPAITAFTNAFSLTEGDGFGKTISDVAGAIKNTVQPIFEAMKGTFDKIKNVIAENTENFQAFWEVVKFIAPKIGVVIGAAVQVIGTVAAGVINLIATIMGAIKPILNFVIDRINNVIDGINIISPFKDIAHIPNIGDSMASAVTSHAAYAAANANATTAAKVSTSMTGGGGGTTASVVGSSKSSTTTNPFAGLGVSGGGSVVASDYAQRNAGMATINNINIGVAGNPEETARVIVGVLNDSYYRGSGGSTGLVTA